MGRPLLWLALLGATFGTLFDWAHVRTGAIEYSHPTRFGIAWWVPLLYVGAAWAIGLSHPLADAWLERRARVQRTPFRLLAGFVGFCAVWFATGALPFSSAIVAAILAPVSLALWFWLDRTRQGFAVATAMVALGVVFEAILIRAGLFRHTHADVFGVAYWLPCIYFAASVGIGNVGRALDPGLTRRSLARA